MTPVTYMRLTYNNRASEARSCATCKFAAAQVKSRSPSDLRDPEEIRCHRHAPIKNDGNQHFFPQVLPSEFCSEWREDDGAERDHYGSVLSLRCDICRHSGPLGGSCRMRAPAAVTHEGLAQFPPTGAAQWCGDHEREVGCETDRYSGTVPGFLAPASRKSA